MLEARPRMSFYVSHVVALVVLVPLASIAVVAFDALSRASAAQNAAASGIKPKPRAPGTVATLSERAVVVGTGGAAVAALFATFRLVAEGKALGIVQLLRCVRVGMTDVSLVLSIDLMRGILATVAAAIATWAAVLLARRTDARSHVALLVSLFGAELALLSDSALGTVAGVTALGLGGALAVTARPVRAFMLAAACALLVLLGHAFLSWGAGGTWLDGDYTPELYPRFSTAKRTSPITEEGVQKREKGSDPKRMAAVSMATMGGAFIYLDDSRTPWEAEKRVIRPPFFEQPIASGMHSFRIHGATGMDDNVISHINIEPGQNLTIVPVGPTLSPRELKDQLSVLAAPTEDLPLPTPDALGATKVLSIRAVTLGALTILLGAAALAFGSLAWGRRVPTPQDRAQALLTLAVAASLSYRVDFLGAIPAALWLLVLAAASALGFFASRAASDPVASLAARLSRVAELVHAFDVRVLDTPFRLAAFARRASIVIAVLLVTFFSTRALAAESATGPAGRLSLTVNGAPGPLVLAQKGSELQGELLIENRGDGPLSILRVAIRTDAHDVRAPPALNARTESPLPTVLKPGGKLKLNVTLSRNTHVEEVFAHVIVTTTDESAGEVAMGIVGHSPSRAIAPLGRNGLRMVLVALAGGAVLVLLLSFIGVDWSGRAAAAAALFALVMVGLIASRFEPALSRQEGNEGLSFIERAPLLPSLGAELYLGADGLSLVLAIGVLVAAVLVSLLGDREKAPPFERPLYLLATAAALGAFFSHDLFVFSVLSILSCVLSTLAVRASARGVGTGLAFGKMRALTLLASIALLLATFALASASEPSFNIVGDRVAHTFSMPDLSRVAFAQSKATFLGAPLVKSAYVVLVLAFAALAGVPPFHSFTVDVLGEPHRPSGAYAVALTRVVGLYGLCHVVLPVLPESCRWAGGGVALWAVLAYGYAAICAFAEKRHGRRLAYLLSAQSAFALLGFASVTPQGVVAILFVSLALLVGSLCAVSLPAFGLALEGEAGVAELDARGRGALLLALAVAAGLPLTPGFFGMFSAVLGASARHPGTVLALVVGAAFSLGAVAKVVPEVLGKTGPGRAVASMQSWAMFGLATTCVLLGVFPATALDFSSSSIRDRIAPADPPGTAEVASR